jgi:polysaccharide biosynthesis transport protein
MENFLEKHRPQRAPLVARFLTQWHRCRKLLRAYWWILPLALAASLGIQWLLLRRLPPSFVSAGQMIVNVKLNIPNDTTYSEELNNFFGTQVALMQSDSVVNQVVQSLSKENPEWQPAPVDVQVTVAPQTSIFDLQAVGENPRYTQAYLQATMDEYITLKKNLFANASSAVKSKIQDELGKLAVKVQASKRALLDFQSSNSVVLLQENGGNSAAAYLSTLNQQLAEDQSELQLLNSLTLDQNLERQREIFTQPGYASRSPSPDAGSSDPNVTAPAASTDPPAGNSGLPNNTAQAVSDGFAAGYLVAKQQLLLLKARRDDLARFLKPKHPDMIAINEEIAHEEKLLEIYRSQSQDQLKDRQHTLEVEIGNLEKQIEKWNVKALDASKKLADYEVLKENNTREQNLYDQLQATLQTLDVDKGIGQESVTILEPATPAVPIPPKTVKHMLLAGLVGLVAAIGILMLLERLDDRPATCFELETQFDQPVLAQFPMLKALDKNTGVPILQLQDDRHMLVEAYQNLRSALIYKDTPANHPRSIVVTSASTNDGKSMVSANFAITLAQSGARVLLVDADLRRGVLHKHFSAPAGPGLAGVFARQCGWANAVVPTSIPNLFLLPSGARPQHPGRLFATEAGKFLADIATHYDYYVFDTAPIMAADDVSSLAPLVDGVIMVIRAGHTSSRIAQAALDLLHLRRVNVIGLVFNAVPTGSGGYYYYRDKNYYPSQPAA